MPKTIQEIKDYKAYLCNAKHSKRMAEQQEDLQFYEDIFELTNDIPDEYIVRTGLLGSAVDNITEHLVTDNPRILRVNNSTRKSESAKERSINVSREVNRWADGLLRQVPNPYKLTTRHMLTFGEMWLHVVHNDILAESEEGKWREDNPDAFPILFLPVNPLIAYLGEEDKDGNVLSAVISYQRMVADIQPIYKQWQPKSNSKTIDMVDFWIYVDDEVKYGEADGNPLWVTPFENTYGFVPLCHSYSGFGVDSPIRDPSELAFSFIRRLRGKAREEATLRSDIAMDIHRFVHRYINVINKSGKPLPEDAFKRYTTEPYSVNELILPPEAEFMVAEALLPDPQVFQHYNTIRADLAMEIPPILKGIPTGVGGRQEDIAKTSGLASFACVIENVSHAWEKAFGMGLRLLYEDKIPYLMPKGLSKEDIGNNYDLRLDLRAEDPIEKARNSVEGRTKVASGLMSRRAYLISIGYTEDEADNLLDEIIAEQYMLQNPDIAAFMGYKVAKEAGMLDEFTQFQQSRQQVNTGQQFPIGRQIGSEGGEPREGNLQSMQGMEMADMMGTRPIRRNPQP